ncbi:MAG: hypothetical protein QXW70_01755 [Candidatus Anstonellales archaeon]
MPDLTLHLTGLSCSSCEKLLEKIARDHNAELKSIDYDSGIVVFYSSENDFSSLKEALALKGFIETNKESFVTRGNWAFVKDYCMRLVDGRDASLEVERRLLINALVSLLTLIFLGALGYFGGMFDSAYLPFLLLAIFASISTAFAYYHMSCYRKGLSCTNGMMIGMTMGMVCGSMFGLLVGATNGMFIGSLVGMTIGIGLGVNLGRFCGVMGAMEGIMAGMMSGPMGAMTSIMLFSDNLLPFLYIFFSLCVIVIFGLSYMMYREVGAAKKEHHNSGLSDFFYFSASLFLAASIIMIAGPKGPLTYI